MEGRNAICEHTDCPRDTENGLKRSRLQPNLIYLGIRPWANISLSKSQIFLLFVSFFFLNVRVGLCGFYSFFTITHYYFSIKKKKHFLWHSEDAGKSAFFKNHSFLCVLLYKANGIFWMGMGEVGSNNAPVLLWSHRTQKLQIRKKIIWKCFPNLNQYYYHPTHRTEKTVPRITPVRVFHCSREQWVVTGGRGM